jgi:hypothetical protein
MNKLTLSLLTLLVSTTAFAQVRGSIVQFSGRYVETGHAYTYAALRTLDGSKIALPAWINGSAVAKFKNNKAVFDAKVENMFCTDMSSACLRGRLVDIKSAKITILGSAAKAETFSGALERHAGMAVESPALYDYISVGTDNISVPSFLDAKALLKLKADLTLVGTPVRMMCTDMSEACGSTDLKPLNSVEIKL